MKPLVTLLFLPALASCAVNVHLYHHWPEEQEVRTPSGQVQIPQSQRQSGGNRAPQSQRQRSPAPRFAEIYISTSPLLAKAVLLSDGVDNTLDKPLGTTPLTIRVSPGSLEPIGPRSCGKTLIFMFELDGFKTMKKSHTLSCSSTADGSVSSPNNVGGTMAPVIATSSNQVTTNNGAR